MEPKLVDFKSEHLDGLGDVLKAKIEGSQSIIFSAEFDGRIIGVAGVTVIDQGIAEAWSVLTDEIKHYPKWLHGRVRRLLDIAFDALSVWRIQATVVKRDKAAIRWISRLGFKREGPINKGVGKRDYWRYAKVR